MNTSLRWHHASLTVSDIEPAMRFFGAVFGFEPLFLERGLADDIALLTGKAGLSADFTQMRSPAYVMILELIAFHHDTEPQPPGDSIPTRPGAGHICFHVDDFDAVVAEVVAHGGTVLGRAIEFPGGRSIYCRVPGGAFLEIEYFPNGQA